MKTMMMTMKTMTDNQQLINSLDEERQNKFDSLMNERYDYDKLRLERPKEKHRK